MERRLTACSVIDSLLRPWLVLAEHAELVKREGVCGSAWIGHRDTEEAVL